MRKSFIFVFLSLAAVSLGRAEVIERVVAVVNGQTILLSDWDTAARMEALMEHKPLDSLTDASRQATFARMIDQQLLRGEMENSSVARSSPEKIATRLREIRQQYPEASADAEWSALLARYGVTEEEVEAAVATELDGLRLIDFRLRSSAQPDTLEINRYYLEVYAPAMRGRRARPAPLADVIPQIREILVQQKLTDLTTTWLQTLRSQANVQMNIAQISAKTAEGAKP